MQERGKDALESPRERVKLLALLDVRCTPKIDDLDISLMIQHDVLVLDIAMNDAVVVEKEERVGDLPKDAADGGDGEAVGVQIGRAHV